MLAMARRQDPRADGRRRFGPPPGRQLPEGRPFDADVEVDAVQERAGNLMGIAAYLAVRTGTAFVEAVAAAGTGIHGRHQDEARRIGQGRLDAGNVDGAVFQGLAQDFQDRPGNSGSSSRKRTP